MCGIAGILIANQVSGAENSRHYLQLLENMTNALSHRGPDGEGSWINEQQDVLLGHRRLTIIDPSEQAAQPMHYLGRYSITHNGEIYNYRELRTTLEQKGYSFRSRSDTEVILAAYDYWKDNCLVHFDGMFAFAIWDQQEQVLFAARDRFGEKPFYYYQDEEHFLFASEMKALWAAGVDRSIEEKMMLNYLTLGHVQNPLDKEQTFFKNIYSLPPAHILKCRMNDFPSRIHPYWKLNKETRIEITSRDATDRFNDLLGKSVTRRLRSDVSLGASLSGGLDSSSIVSFMTENSSQPGFPFPQGRIPVFSAVFPGFARDESGRINQLASAFNLESHQIQPGITGLISEFEKLCYHQEEPFQSSGIYAQFKVFELAKTQGVKVLLDGQGADEILAGYPRYIHWYLQEVLSRHKLGATEKEKKLLLKNHYSFRWNIKNIMAAFLPAHAAIQLEKNEYRRITHDPNISPDFIKSLVGHEWEGIHKPIVTKLNDILYFNTVEMGLEELLRFADRNSMAHGLELRLPFLNHELVEFVFSLPSQLKIHEGYTKWLLRKARTDKIPAEVAWNTEKIGFETPQQQWMQDPALIDFIQESRRKLVTAGMLAPSVLQKKIIPKPAYDENNQDWRYLTASQFI
ncbi:MAG: asparagine synthase (glutamine-hydrolyzing) [Chitinophagaceae bacterium]|nr:asparagine synthase (glutamine-hydrolyzing) [Chitinophagaceae bacterium]